MQKTESNSMQILTQKSHEKNVFVWNLTQPTEQ